MFCTKCGTQVVEGAQFCTQCGQVLGARPAPGAPAAAGDDEYLETAIGHRNLDYYLRRFERFSSGGGFVSWNWPSFFVPLIWMLYRKMWVYALVYFFLLPFAMGAVFAVLLLVLPPTPALIAGWTVQLAVLFVLIPMYANALYFRTVRDRIADAKAYRGDREKQLRMLASAGGTSNAALIVVLIMVVPTIGVLAAIAIPAYQDYTIRAQVSEGLNLAAAPKAAVEEAFLRDGAVPPDREYAGLSPNPADTSGKYVRSIEVTDGRIDIFYGDEANSTIAGKVLSLTPYGHLEQGDDWSVLWRCGHGEVPADATHEISPYEPGTLEPRYLPSACRP
jgi:type IV pilus assembly protein PilA